MRHSQWKPFHALNATKKVHSDYGLTLNTMVRFDVLRMGIYGYLNHLNLKQLGGR